MFLAELLVKEEYRTNTLWVSDWIYLSLPIVFTFLLTWTFGFATSLGLPLDAAVDGTLFLAFVLGLPSGFVTIMKREMFSHSIGEVSFLVSNAYSLPIREIDLFFAFIARELFFTLLFFIFPISLSLTSAGASFPTLFPSLLMAYLFGVLASFAASTLYRHLHLVALPLLVLLASAAALYPSELLPFLFLYGPPLQNLESYAVSTALLTLALPFASFYYEPKVRSRGEIYSRLRPLFPPLFSKDIVALSRTGFFPSLLLFQTGVILFSSLLSSLLPLQFFLPYTLGLFSVIPWFVLNFLDQPHLYRHLPLPENSFLRSKLSSFLLSSLAGLMLLWVAGFWAPLDPITSAVVYLSSLAYTLYVTYKLVGLDVQKFFRLEKMTAFLVLLIPCGLILDISIFFGGLPLFAAGTLLLLLLASWLR